MVNKVYVFDSHPVQYKAPVYQAMQLLGQDSFEVIYATDASVRAGHVDQEFGKEVVWDMPLLKGYAFRVLGNERGTPLSGPTSLTGRGIFKLLRSERPAAVMLTQSRYLFDHAAYLSSWLLGIPILIRQETQDEMFAGRRSWLKERIRTALYRLMYSQADHFLAFGQLNHDHLTRHGASASSISFARFSVPNPLQGWSTLEKENARTKTRQSLNISGDRIVLAFFGKFIDKKNPELVYESLNSLPSHVRHRLHLVFVGAGELQGRLETMAKEALDHHGVPSSFTGFINQSQLFNYYLAADTVILPSRRMGEAWGLVINEAMNAGCHIVMSDAVGCAAEFGSLDRVKIIPVGHHQALGQAIAELSQYERDFDWARQPMSLYSTEAAAASIMATFNRYTGAAA